MPPSWAALARKHDFLASAPAGRGRPAAYTASTAAISRTAEMAASTSSTVVVAPRLNRSVPPDSSVPMPGAWL